MDFMDMTWQERSYEITSALAQVLPGLLTPAPTTVVVEKLRRVLPGGVGRTPADAVARELLRLAPKHPNATHNGTVKLRFGRSVTGWLWHATAQSEGSVFKQQDEPPAFVEPEHHRIARLEHARLMAAAEARDHKTVKPEEW